MKPPPRTCRPGQVAASLTLAALLAMATVATAQVDEWRGNKRVTAPLLSPVPAPPVYPTPLPETRGITLPPLPVPPRPAPPVVQASATQPAPQERPPATDLGRLGRSTGELLGEVCAAIDTYRDTVQRGRQRMQAAADAIRLMPTPPGEVRLVPVPPSPPETTPRHKAESAARPVEAYGSVWAQVGLIAGAMLVCPLLVALLVVVMLRRTGLQLRVEVINPTASGPLVARVGPGWAVLPGGPEATEAPQPTLPAEEEPTAERFELGPTYEEEQQARAEEQRHKELAVLQQVFEDNVRLRDEIASLPPEEAGK